MDLSAAGAAVEIEPEWSGDDSPPLKPHARYRANEGIPAPSRRRVAGAWGGRKNISDLLQFPWQWEPSAPERLEVRLDATLCTG